jgi:hypothetical protein
MLGGPHALRVLRLPRHPAKRNMLPQPLDVVLHVWHSPHSGATRCGGQRPTSRGITLDAACPLGQPNHGKGGRAPEADHPVNHPNSSPGGPPWGGSGGFPKGIPPPKQPMVGTSSNYEHKPHPLTRLFELIRQQPPSPKDHTPQTL